VSGMKKIRIGLISLGFAITGSAYANLELAQAKTCTACHAVDKQVLGPALREVAKRYAKNPDALALVSESIKKGGTGKWGQIPMPAQDGLSDADVKTLAQWILKGAK
jgi:cytochrome c